MTSDRYARQTLIHGWNQSALSAASLLVIGAGALGNETLKNLALLGVGHVLILDFDTIETSNLSRTVLFRDADVGLPKARVAAERVRKINPEMRVEALCGNVFYDIGLGFFRHADLVIGCLDNIAARSHVGVCCSLAGTPYLDGGMWGLGGEVRWFLPGETACFECTLTEEDRRQASERRSCTGLRRDDPERTIPTTINTAAIIGGLLSQEAARLLCGGDVGGGEAFVYNGQTARMHRSTLPRKPDCPYHAPYHDVVELDDTADTLSAASLLDRARADLGNGGILELGRDFLQSFHCSRCDNAEEVNQSIGVVPESRSRCQTCGSERTARIISRVEPNDAVASRTLAHLGIPPGEVVAVRNHQQTVLFELAH